MSRRTSMIDAMKLRSTRNMESFLHSASELSNHDNDIEKPAEKKRCVDIDGHKVIFTLVKNETQRPKASRKERQEFEITNKNVKLPGNCHERKIRRFLLTFDIPALTVMYLVSFVVMNACFAGLWSIESDGCCGDGSMTFWQHFDFAVQTSSTIGYGGYWPRGYWNNTLVVLLTAFSILFSTVYAGLVFFKFITPEANIEFSEVMTLSNVMGQSCIEIRVGNVDASSNKLINAEASLTVVSHQEYQSEDEGDKVLKISQPEDLKLAVTSQHLFFGVWTLRHFIDETSPLYGFRFDEFPGSTIIGFQLNIKAIQSLTKGEVYAQTRYQVEDLLVGHAFEDQAIWETAIQTAVFDYDKMSSTRPSFVWYPQKKDILDCGDAVVSA
ncbi:unnamed protein product [Cylindrotheca closterium]|uniref:Inward rectifier potassium channel C-terminal domain-containing protein n=1 Tax=Cylindrotheca closterium TaxID=2856 RepID=A0AAD2FQ76_9STRA|nr:unnamed protein product [Cylindrotheca closterium]